MFAVQVPRPDTSCAIYCRLSKSCAGAINNYRLPFGCRALQPTHPCPFLFPFSLLLWLYLSLSDESRVETTLLPQFYRSQFHQLNDDSRPDISGRLRSLLPVFLGRRSCRLLGCLDSRMRIPAGRCCSIFIDSRERYWSRRTL